MHFDWAVSLGTLLTIAAFVVSMWVAANRIYMGLDRRLSKFQSLLTEHASTLLAHNVHMEKQDDLLLRLVGDMQRLIGRLEGESTQRNNKT